MFARTAAFAVLLFAVAGPKITLAETMIAKVDAKSADELGFSVKVSDRDDGLVSLTVVRDLAKVQAHAPDSEMTITRNLHLYLHDGKREIARINLAGEEAKGKITYHAAFHRDLVEHSTFSCSEYDDYRDSARKGKLLGGGTIYQFGVVTFVKQTEGQAEREFEKK